MGVVGDGDVAGGTLDGLKAEHAGGQENDVKLAEVVQGPAGFTEGPVMAVVPNRCRPPCSASRW